MRHHDHHLADEDLLLALDRELPPDRHSDAEGHLLHCAACRTRCEQIKQAAAAFGEAYRRSLEVDGAANVARARMQSALRVEATRLERGWLAPFLSAASTAPRWAVVSAALALAAVVGFDAYQTRLFERQTTLPASGHPALPMASLTPGATMNVGVEEICSGRSERQAHLPATLRQQVLRAYGMEGVPAEEYELDYLITPALGGAPDARNLWPERYAVPTWNAYVKDQLEELLPQLVCSGQLDLATAQRDIAVDWIAAYKKYFKTSYPLRSTSAADDDNLEFAESEMAAYVVTESPVGPAIRLISR